MKVHQTTAQKAAEATALADRRRQVSTLLLARVSGQEIARRLGQSEATISRDRAAIHTMWRTETVANRGAEVDAALLSLDADEAALRGQLAQLQADEATRRKAWDAAHAKTEAPPTPEKALNAQLAIRDRLLRIGERRARLLGLDAAEKHDLRGADGGPIEIAAVVLTDTERASRAAAILARAAARLPEGAAPDAGP